MWRKGAALRLSAVLSAVLSSLLLVAGGAIAETLLVPHQGPPLSELAKRRFENLRSDCRAQWQGHAKARHAIGQSESDFMETCLAGAQARCHPKGSDPACDYRRTPRDPEDIRTDTERRENAP